MAADAHRRLVAIAGADRAVRLWDTRDFTHPRRVGPTLPGSAVSLSSDGGLLAVADDRDGKVRLWNTSDPRHPARLTAMDLPGELIGNVLALSPDGRLLAAGGDRVYLWDVHDRRHVARLPRSLPGGIPAFGPRGHVLATADIDTGIVRLWNTASAARPGPLGSFSTGSAGAQDIVFSPDGRTLATDDTGDSQVRLWDIGHPARPQRLPDGLTTSDDSEVAAVVFSPDGRLAAVAGENGVQLWIVAADDGPERLGEPLGQWSHEGIALVFGRDSRTLLTDDRVLRAWSLPPTLVLGCSSASVDGISPDGRTLATSCGAEKVQLWNTADPGHPRPLGRVSGSAATFSPGGHLLAAADPSGGTGLWDVGNPARPRRLGRTSAAHDRVIASLSFSADGRTLAAYEVPAAKVVQAGDRNAGGLVEAEQVGEARVRLWQVGDPHRPKLLGSGRPPGQEPAVSLALSPDARTLAATGSDGRIRLWDTHDAAHPALLAPVLTGDSIAFAPHGHTLAVAGTDGALRLWDTTRAARPRPLSPSIDATGSVSALAFGPDGRTLSTGTADGTIRLWNVTDPAHPSATGDALVGHTGSVQAAVLGPGGRILATAGDDGTVRLWELDVDRIVHRICAETGHALTRPQWRRHLGSLPYRPPCP